MLNYLLWHLSNSFFCSPGVSSHEHRLLSLDAGIMPLRPVPPATKTTWLKLADVFSKLLGGTEDGQRAHLYLTQLATDSLPREALAPLPWHASPPDVEVMPVAQNEPHECVLAVLCPSVPLRVVWRRRR